jgi:hypothetical protein
MAAANIGISALPKHKFPPEYANNCSTVLCRTSPTDPMVWLGPIYSVAVLEICWDAVPKIARWWVGVS